MPEYVIFEACPVRKKNLCDAKNRRLPGEQNIESNLKDFIVVKFCEKRSSSVGGIMLFLSSWAG